MAENRVPGRPAPFSTGVHSAWRLAADRRQWHQIVDTAIYAPVEVCHQGRRRR